MSKSVTIKLVKPKSSAWVGYIHDSIPLDIFIEPPVIGVEKTFSNIAFLKEKLEIHIIKVTDSNIKIQIHRIWKDPNEITDNGYALRFYITIVGLDQDTLSITMKQDQEIAEDSDYFILSENVRANINRSQHFFELFVVIRMLELKSLDKNVYCKEEADRFMSCVKEHLTESGRKVMGYILNSPELEDTFTGRLPLRLMKFVKRVILSISKDFNNEVFKYIYARTRYLNDEECEMGNLELHKVLKIAGLANENGVLPIQEAIQLYFLAHEVGLAFLKLITSDYLAGHLKKDCYVLDVLQAALVVHDENLIYEAVLSFVTDFHKITSSEKFESLTRNKGHVTRLITHIARVWMPDADIPVPEWHTSAPATTENVTQEVS